MITMQHFVKLDTQFARFVDAKGGDKWRTRAKIIVNIERDSVMKTINEETIIFMARQCTSCMWPQRATDVRGNDARFHENSICVCIY